MSDRTALIVFVRAPRHGAVKTRLAQTMGDAAALAAYNELVRSVLGTLIHRPHVQLCFSPDDAFEEIKPWLQPTWSARPQGSGDLGQRMFRSFSEAFARGETKTIIVGSDCPDLTIRDIGQASAQLNDHDLVLGPSEDGGYWLIGLRKPEPELFRDMLWSTDQVLRETVRRATVLKLRIGLLRVLRDIDTVDDWKDYLARRGETPHL